MKHSTVLVLGFIAFAGVFAAIVGSRLSDQTMMLLAGAACGAGLTAPFAVLGGMYFGAQRATRDYQPAQPQPPIVVMTPQPQQPTLPALPAWGNVYPSGLGATAPSSRQYTILGEETVIDGTSDFWQ